MIGLNPRTEGSQCLEAACMDGRVCNKKGINIISFNGFDLDGFVLILNDTQTTFSGIKFENGLEKSILNIVKLFRLTFFRVEGVSRGGPKEQDGTPILSF